MFFVMYAAWFIFNGRITLEIALFGLVLCVLLYLFQIKFLGLTFKKEWAVAKRLQKGVCYFGFLLKEIVLANMDVLRLILNPKVVIEPQIKVIHTDLKTEMGKTILADSITLTPGTITVDMKGNELTVHCLDNSLSQGLENSQMGAKIKELEDIK